MIRLVVVAILFASALAGCRVSLEDDPGADPNRVCMVSTSQQCEDAETAPATLSWIETNIFEASCNFAGCHNGAAGNESSLDLRPSMSGAELVNGASSIDPMRKFVVPNDVEKSWLMLMLRAVPPAMADPPVSGLPAAGGMPQGAEPLCCQKLDAIERWINAGAPTT